MLIRRLEASDAAAFLAVRLEALQLCPTAFGASVEEEVDTPLETLQANLAPDSGRYRFGAFDGEQLVGIIGLGREAALKLRHRAYLIAVYVTATHRGQGIGRALAEHALAFASSMPGLLQITLDVTDGNDAAQSLYASLGFTVYGRMPCAMLVDGQAYDQILMARPQ